MVISAAASFVALIIGFFSTACVDCVTSEMEANFVGAAWAWTATGIGAAISLLIIWSAVRRRRPWLLLTIPVVNSFRAVCRVLFGLLR